MAVAIGDLIAWYAVLLSLDVQLVRHELNLSLLLSFLFIRPQCRRLPQTWVLLWSA